MFKIDKQATLGYVRIKVTDLTRATDFYTRVLGLQKLDESSNEIVFTVDGKTPLLVIEGGAEPKRGRTTGLYHYAIVVPERKDLANILRNLILQQYPLQGASDHYTHEALYLADPDGNGIEMYFDRPREYWTGENGEVIFDSGPLDLQAIFKESNEHPFNGLPVGTKMGHVHLHVADLKAAEHFYTNVLGLDFIARYGDQAVFVSAGGYHHHVGMNTWAGVGAPKPPSSAVGLAYFTVELSDANALQEIVDHIKQVGVHIESHENGYYVTDPSGNGILLRII